MTISKRLRELADKLERDVEGLTTDVGRVCHHWAMRAGRAIRDADQLPEKLRSIVASVEAGSGHDDAKSNTVFLQAVQVWLGNSAMLYEDIPANPNKKAEALVGKYAENMRALAMAIEPAGPPGGYYHPIFDFANQLKNRSNKRLNRPEIARAYIASINGPELAKLKAEYPSEKQLETHFVDKLRNHNN